MRFSRDRRGQSVVIGTVILFGFLILALSLYQVQVVPQQNGQVEFQHFEEVRNDLVELRNAISSAGQSERPQFVDVRLGTNYQTRLFAINPPDPAGTLQTSQPYNITIDDGTNEPVNISTRFVRYRPGYNELHVGSIWYDNSVLYLDERDSGSRAVIIEDQNLVVDNDTLRITALQNEFQASGTRRVALELYPTDDAANLSQLEGELNVSIPTRLDADDGYWKESIENSSSVRYVGIDDNEYRSSDDVSALRLEVESSDNIIVNSVGIQSEPSEGAVSNSGQETDSDDNSGSNPTQASGINSDGDANTFWGSSGVQFNITNNGDGPAQIESISVDSTTSAEAEVLKERNGGSGPGLNEIFVESSSNSGFYEAGDGGSSSYSFGPQVDLSSTVSINTGRSATITLTFFQGGPGGSTSRVDMTGEKINLTFYLGDGSQKSLTISVPN
ncbi:hypothetical protein [Halorubrum depositum]|uniref:hypothetical protein n=1 Tax=Halorubrum depositum TaxID=2583992 RepID=UPI0011A18CEE|nr:hypothetical protein [Halorubrum depositum]